MKEVLNAYKAQKMLADYAGVAKSELVKKISEIKLHLPLVLKIVSPSASHKTEIKGVRIVKTKMELDREFNSLIDITKKKIKLEGILVQEYLEGQEFIIGIKKDSVFGHVIAFGMGGIYTELLKDTSTRKCPINENDAEEMLLELKSKKLFSKEGFRGKKLNTSLLKKTLIDISKIPNKYKQITEMDVNPFILNEKDGKVADARIIFN